MPRATAWSHASLPISRIVQWDMNTARSTEAEERLCSEALTSEVGILQNL